MRNRFDTIATVLGVTGILGALVVFGLLSYTAPDTKQIYDPSQSGDPRSRGFRQLFARDAIRCGGVSHRRTSGARLQGDVSAASQRRRP